MYQAPMALENDTYQWVWTEGYWVLDYSPSNRDLLIWKLLAMTTHTDMRLSEQSEALIDEVLNNEIEAVAKFVH